jgi:citrate synthase
MPLAVRCCAARRTGCFPPYSTRTRSIFTTRNRAAVVFAYPRTLALPYVYPCNDLSYTGNFLSILFKTTELRYKPNPSLERAVDVLFIVHADPEQNRATNALHAVASSQVDLY